MKIKVIDGVRALAAISVIVSHLPLVGNSNIGVYLNYLIDGSKIGYLAVDVFFILSGFLITRIIIKEKRNMDFSLQRFYFKRVLRIFPIYYLVVVLCGLFITWNQMGYAAGYISNYHFPLVSGIHPMRHTWSLSVEEHFYLIWPIILGMTSLDGAKKFVTRAVPLILLISILMNYVTLDYLSANALLYRGTQFRMLSLALGAYLAFQEDQVRYLSKSRTAQIAGILICSYAAALVAHKIIPYRPVVDVIRLLGLAAVSFFTFILVLQFENRKNSFGFFVLTNRLSKLCGSISYGLYLYHYPIFYICGFAQAKTNNVSVGFDIVVLALLLTFAVAVGSYFLIELPLLRLKDSINPRGIFDLKTPSTNKLNNIS